MSRPLLRRLGEPFVAALLLVATSTPLAAQDVTPAQPLDGVDTATAAARTVGFPLQPGVWRLDGADPDLPFADLEPLRGIVGKATVVGLGESIHTSGGYYEAKHRLFRYLVEKLGFRVIAFETPWLDGDTANAYVQTCDGDPDAATAGFFGVWRSAELSALIGWMCEWNRTHPKAKDRVSVYAFDVQWQAAEDAAALAEFLGRVDVDAAAEPYAGLGRCAEVETVFRATTDVPDEAGSRCDAAVQAVAELLAANDKPFTQRVGKTDLAWVNLRLAGLQSWLEEMVYYRSDFPRAYAARDRGMATLFQGIRALRYSKAKVALWAHNGHITRDPAAYGLTTMGSHLAAALGKKYVILGLTSWEVSIDWPSVGCGPQPLRPSPFQPVENILHGFDEEALLVDLRFPGTSDPLLAPGGLYNVGNASMVPARAFDALVYLDRSRKMTPLAWAPCQ